MENYLGHTFRFSTRQELEEMLESYFSPGLVEFDTYEDSLGVTVTTTADNTHAITQEVMQAFHAGKCCLWQYTLCLSRQDGTLSGFVGNEGLQDIPYDAAALERLAAPARRRIEAAWQMVCRERDCASRPALTEVQLDLIMQAMDWNLRTVPRLHEIVSALRPYNLAEYDTVAQAYADLFGCLPQRAEELVDYYASYPQHLNSPEERIRWREDICYAEFSPNGKTYLIKNY